LLHPFRVLLVKANSLCCLTDKYHINAIQLLHFLVSKYGSQLPKDDRQKLFHALLFVLRSGDQRASSDRSCKFGFVA
jgi:hypothetical protein